MGSIFWSGGGTGLLFFIDIAVPRDVDPRMNEVEGCFVYDIDDLQQVAQANLADRGREAEAAETIVSREVEKYQERLQARDAVPAILALQQGAEAVREAELARAGAKLAGVDGGAEGGGGGADAVVDGEAAASAAGGAAEDEGWGVGVCYDPRQLSCCGWRRWFARGANTPPYGGEAAVRVGRPGLSRRG